MLLLALNLRKQLLKSVCKGRTWDLFVIVYISPCDTHAVVQICFMSKSIDCIRKNLFVDLYIKMKSQMHITSLSGR